MRRVSRLLRIAVTAVAVVAGAGCGWIGSGGPTGPRQRSIDELAGSYKGVALGDPRAAAIGVFGKPASTDSPAYPMGVGFSDGGPLLQRNPRGNHERPDLLRYEDVSFLSTPACGIHSIVVDDSRSATQKGVGVGDSLAAAKRAYPSLRCRKAENTGESPSPAHCSGKLAADRYIWFGNDPIEIIALSPTPME